MSLNLAIALVRDGWDAGDPWGSAMLALGDVADVMYAAGLPVPEELEYRPSPLTDERTLADIVSDDPGTTPYDARVIASECLAGRIDARTLRLAALTLNRYADACRAAGLDY